MIFLLCSCKTKEGVCDIKNGCDESILIHEADIPFEIIDFKQAYDFVINDNSGVLLFSFNDCPYCATFLPVLKDVANNFSGIKTYYVNVSRQEREAGNDIYDKFVELLKPQLEENGYDKIYMPTIIFISNGDVALFHSGTIENALELSQEQYKLLYDLIEIGYYSI